MNKKIAACRNQYFLSYETLNLITRICIWIFFLHSNLIMSAYSVTPWGGISPYALAYPYFTFSYAYYEPSLQGVQNYP